MTAERYGLSSVNKGSEVDCGGRWTTLKCTKGHRMARLKRVDCVVCELHPSKSVGIGGQDEN